MASGPGSLLRHTAATLMCVSGIGQIAALWMRDLTAIALIDGLWGTVYLAIGIGLFGQARLSLFLGIVIPSAAIAAVFYTVPRPEQIYALRIAIDVVVMLLCAIVVWETRHHPGL
jgi:hypothetical protein